METMVSTNNKERIREALELLQETARDESQQLKSLARNRYAELKSVLGEAKVSLDEESGRLLQLKARGEEKVRDFAGHVDEYVHETPWRVIATAAALGVLAGLLINRTRH